ncbi:2-oxoacid:ferredoxin oxidoreductase subunit beta [Vibrio sp. Vb2110]|uniref:2-oxoacid:ferredoxin oxidoreductase subunit beta n=1 Tax=unclassified Vibrio TaxID=2614977 RepID=UPI00280763CE|nr:MULTISPECIES: 2-oxoacid:ferredoxin oxidoreductase subunit beta [unclassified Vibrio]EJE8515945.1 2-oxoacid:ferredoxin oxidoreductase subunit beta [Vibrio parahaemolyticus]EJE8774741.1 2-oxoacid:ferredoxin oxidoreductase subunit beta [Vibrio parahaemolyticus]ELA9196562.1 2-oxoacid:ferredoxin oxidoreductase subunit beta [Vibrio parahaemolyticus]MDG3414597.1 2-oxoacid:ferredoxin oxidoreductase subunit beta [Vibrio parahaemolyticus]MDW1848670.1 2-oxoacid:ferredoxin oxidoreductase subunit beta [
MLTRKLNRKDFSSDVEIKWCRGCGDFNVLKTMQSVLAKLEKTRENTVFISGIGCSSRFPYYLDTYGFHTIHGRAPAIATGVKATNPELDVWVVTGDGDALSIGGNHFIHAIRRNQDIKILLFNNAVYGLTKGQYSPTSEQGFVSKSSPGGSPDVALKPLAIAASAGATFLARTSDNDPTHMAMVFEAAAAHSGTAVIEVLQNCIIFNDKVHDPYNGPSKKQENLLYLKENEPLIFGKENSKMLVGKGFGFQVTNVDVCPPLIHSPKEDTTQYAYALANLCYPEFPVPVGIFRQVTRPTYDQIINHQEETAKQKYGKGNLTALLHHNTYERMC